jgi:predicted nucleic acid-binding protein
MAGFLDTNVVVRYLTNDPPHLAARAAAIIDRDDDLYLTDAALAEAAYVLTSSKVYGLPRASVISELIEFCRKKNVSIFGLDKTTVIQALEMCQPSAWVSVDDALIWAAARSSEARRVYTFDKDPPDFEIEVRGTE